MAVNQTNHSSHSIWAHERGIDADPIDGYWGQRTNTAFEMLEFLFANGRLEPAWRSEERKIVKPKLWPVQNTQEFHSFYGEKSTQLVTIDFPYEMKISGDQRMKSRRVSCHSKVADSLARVLYKVKHIYGEREIDRLQLNNYGGCYNNRKMRGGNLWSIHAWGIALDFDPDRNRLKWGRDQAAFAHPYYHDWWKCGRKKIG